MKKIQALLILLILIIGISALIVSKFGLISPKRGLNSVSPTPNGRPLEKYSIVNAANYPFQASHFKIEKTLNQTTDFTSYLFSMQTLGKQMTGVMNIPTNVSNPQPVIIMARGYVEAEKYYSGQGTQHAGEFLARHGFVTIAPDFLGYGGSDPESSDQWEARLQKPLSLIEILKTVQAEPITLPATASDSAQVIHPGKIGFWAHSNGGQITISALETLNQAYPTTLWAPVTAPFPYSIMYFTNEDADEGKAARKWLAEFEQIYDVFDFSLTDHLDRLHGDLLLHQGTADTSVPLSWSDTFVANVKTENQRRSNLAKQVATGSAQAQADQNLDSINLTYYTYPGADHNLTPGWNTVVERDLEFFNAELGR